MALNLDKFLAKPIVDAIQKGIREYEPQVRKQANKAAEAAGLGAALGVIYIGSMVLFPIPTVAVSATGAALASTRIAANAKKREVRNEAQANPRVAALASYGAEHSLFSFKGIAEVFVGGARSAAQFLTKGPSFRTLTFLAGATVGGCALAAMAPALLPAGAALTLNVGATSAGAALGLGSVTIGAKALGFAVPAVLMLDAARSKLGVRRYIRKVRTALEAHEKKVASAREEYDESLGKKGAKPKSGQEVGPPKPEGGEKRAKFAGKDGQKTPPHDGDKPPPPADDNPNSLSRLPRG